MKHGATNYNPETTNTNRVDHKVMTRVTIFGSSQPKPTEPLYQEAYELGKQLALSGVTICNGGYGGTMEASAKGAVEADGKTTGVVCERFGVAANPFIQEKIIVNTHSERLHKLIELGDAYIVLRGSTGTLVELALVWEYMNKSIMPEKPIIVLGDFWKPVIDTLKNEFVFEGKDFATKYVTLARTIEECMTLLPKELHG
ncbi:MAG: LOG family protein [Bacteroidetes bacterium]|nr:MAG: LOG family protein [Bacteroidota bacterium]